MFELVKQSLSVSMIKRKWKKRLYTDSNNIRGCKYCGNDGAQKVDHTQYLNLILNNTERPMHKVAR